MQIYGGRLMLYSHSGGTLPAIGIGDNRETDAISKLDGRATIRFEELNVFFEDSFSQLT